ncbi:hypothetical protein HPB51_017177 [Rhipicephalus microplus]|uniref:Uncharacterized protein n=1 Tax=Rhipicephalus microplus TaxID=6941 RepID=A0A9J6EBF5_RHIMP|nr:hypothetical protein HPB51_017177 [Rhipicephalus microplus]
MMMGRPANPNRGMRRPSDPEMGLPNASAASASPGNPFSDKYIRIGFIRKVYAILSVQLLITAAIIAAFIFVFYKRDEVMMAVGITAHAHVHKQLPEPPLVDDVCTPLLAHVWS